MARAEKIFLFIACITAVTCVTATAFACKSKIICDIERIEGDVPCVGLTARDASCEVTAVWACKQDDPSVTLTRLNSTISVTLGGETAPMSLGAGSYTWERGEQSGTIEIIGASRSSGGCPQQDVTCAMAPASRAVHTPQILILTLSLIAGWRRHKNHT